MTEYDFEEQLPGGKPRYTLCENGAVRDNKIRKIVAGPRMSTEQARALALRRYALARERAVEGIDEAAIEKGLIPRGGSGEGWKAVVQHVAKTLLESKNIRGLAEAGNFLGRASGFTQSDEQNADVASRLAAILENFNRRTIEGTVRNVD